MQCINCGAPIYGSSDACTQCGIKGSPFTITGAAPGTPMGAHGGAQQPAIPDHLILALLATLMFCMPLGIVALIFANQVAQRQMAGDYRGALVASRKAKQWSLWAIGSCVGLVLLTCAGFLAALLM